MFFTREDILKIQQALFKVSVKDSELPNAEPVTPNDIKSIVQNGKNKKIKIVDFLEQISLGDKDIINISNKYDEHYISLSEAINLVPELQRREGLFITFQDVNGNWQFYQFRGILEEFSKKDKWFNLDFEKLKTEGTATQVLMADGSVKTLNANNGIAGLDSNGNVPLAQLGNLDTTVAEVVTALPTTNIKKHIYLIKDASNVTQNKYEEYIYTGDTSATYDASKWEKLGDFRATVDLANYYTKSQVDSIANGKSSTSHTHSVIINGVTKTIAASGGAAVNLGTYLTSHQSLAEYAKKSDAATSLEITPSANDIQFVLRSISGSEIDWPSLDPASSTKAGIMTTKDKVKLDGIDDRATADSAITTAEIDALFT